MESLKKGMRHITNLAFPRLCESTGEPLEGLASDRQWEYLCADAATTLHSLDMDHACGLCGVPLYGLIEGERICAACKAKPPVWGKMGALMRYHGAAREWVRHYKYRSARYLEADFAKLARSKSAELCNFFDGAVVIPVPLHPLKEFLRGFNQSETLFRTLLRSAGAQVEFAPQLLRRIRWTRPQASLRRRARAANVKNAFDINAKITLNKWQSRRVIVVDDLLTSGLTLSACVKALQSAGFTSVDVFCFART